MAMRNYPLPRILYACDAYGCSKDKAFTSEELKWSDGTETIAAGWFCSGCAKGLKINSDGPYLFDILDRDK